MKTLLTFQNIDAPLDAIDDIANSAINLNAHLHVLLIGLASFAPVAVYAEAPAYDWSENYAQIIRDTHKKSNELSEYLNKLGASATVLPVCDAVGSIPGIAADNALFADYAILPAERQLDDVLRKRFLEGVMFNANTPTLLFAKDQVINKPINRVVIGWHPSPNTAAAVRSCLPLLDKTTDVNITIVDSSPVIYGQTPGSEIATFLARHGIKPSIDLISSNGKPTGEMLIQHSSDINADLLVMGAYGRSRFKEWLLGGTTRDVLETLSIPTLVSH